MEKEYRSVWKKMGPNQGINKVLPQVPKTRMSIPLDAARSARLPGKRISRTGNAYWETRENRSDNLKSNL